jgi:hypothetical protein
LQPHGGPLLGRIDACCASHSDGLGLGPWLLEPWTGFEQMRILLRLRDEQTVSVTSGELPSRSPVWLWQHRAST